MIFYIISLYYIKKILITNPIYAIYYLKNVIHLLIIIKNLE